MRRRWRSTKPSLVPIPFFEEICDGIAEAGEQMLAIQESARADELALRQRMTDFNHFGFWIDDPRDLGAAGKEIAETVVNFRAGIGGRENFHGEVGSARKEAFVAGLKTKRFEAASGNEGKIRGATIAIEHPEARAGVKHGAEAMLIDEVANGDHQAGADASVKPNILGAHNQLAVDQFMKVAVVRQILQVGLGPNFLRDVNRNAHDLRV